MRRRPEGNPDYRRLQELARERDGQRPAPRPDVAAEDNPREPPRDTGKRFATLTRPGRGGRPDTETRVAVDTFEGHEFGKLHVWQRGTDGVMYPTRKIVTLRKSELYETIKALCAIARELGVDLHPKSGGEKGAGDA